MLPIQRTMFTIHAYAAGLNDWPLPEGHGFRTKQARKRLRRGKGKRFRHS